MRPYLELLDRACSPDHLPRELTLTLRHALNTALSCGFLEIHSVICQRAALALAAGLAATGWRRMRGYGAHQSTNDTRRFATLVALGVA